MNAVKKHVNQHFLSVGSLRFVDKNIAFYECLTMCFSAKQFVLKSVRILKKHKKIYSS